MLLASCILNERTRIKMKKVENRTTRNLTQIKELQVRHFKGFSSIISFDQRKKKLISGQCDTEKKKNILCLSLVLKVKDFKQLICLIDISNFNIGHSIKQ